MWGRLQLLGHSHSARGALWGPAQGRRLTEPFQPLPVFQLKPERARTWDSEDVRAELSFGVPRRLQRPAPWPPWWAGEGRPVAVQGWSKHCGVGPFRNDPRAPPLSLSSGAPAPRECRAGGQAAQDVSRARPQPLGLFPAAHVSRSGLRLHHPEMPPSVPGALPRPAPSRLVPSRAVGRGPPWLGAVWRVSAVTAEHQHALMRTRAASAPPVHWAGLGLAHSWGQCPQGAPWAEESGAGLPGLLFRWGTKPCSVVPLRGVSKAGTGASGRWLGPELLLAGRGCPEPAPPRCW